MPTSAQEARTNLRTKYLKGRSLTSKDANGNVKGGKEIGEKELLKMLPEFLKNELNSPKPTLQLEDLRTMVEDRQTLPYRNYAARDLSENEVALVAKYLENAMVEQRKRLGEQLSAAVSTITAQASSNQQELEQRLDKLQAGVGTLLNTSTSIPEASSRQKYLWAREKALEERRAEYAMLCEKFGHSHDQPPVKIGEYIKAISDLKKQIAQREREAKAAGEAALLAAKQAEYEASLPLCTNPHGCAFAAADISTWTLHRKLNHFIDAIEEHREMAKAAAEQAATDEDADVDEPAAAENVAQPTAAEHAVPATAAAKEKPTRPRKRKATQQIQKPTARMSQEKSEQLCQEYDVEATGTKKAIAKRLRKKMAKGEAGSDSALDAETVGAEAAVTGECKVVLALDSGGTETIDITREEMDEIVLKWGDQEIYPNECTPMIKRLLGKSARTSAKNSTACPSESADPAVKRCKTGEPAGESSGEASENERPDVSGGAAQGSGSSFGSNASPISAPSEAK